MFLRRVLFIAIHRLWSRADYASRSKQFFFRVFVLPVTNTIIQAVVQVFVGELCPSLCCWRTVTPGTGCVSFRSCLIFLSFFLESCLVYFFFLLLLHPCLSSLYFFFVISFTFLPAFSLVSFVAIVFVYLLSLQFSPGSFIVCSFTHFAPLSLLSFLPVSLFTYLLYSLFCP